MSNAENVWGRKKNDNVPSSLTSVSAEFRFSNLNRVFVGGPDPDILRFSGESILE